MNSFDDEEVQLLRSRLLGWYDEHRRDLPWRAVGSDPPDPYRIWLSEVMLQQTRVETVRPYFDRWVERFPDLESLAAANLDDVLKAWEGLGYYSRARNLHRAVREVVADHDGHIPRDANGFRALPGVGRYTAGAVMSIAFGQEEPVVDGNVKRVFARLFDVEFATDAELWTLAATLVRGGRPGDLNQAVMELGATVCTPRRPACGVCPISTVCLASARGTVERRPGPRRRAPVPTERHALALAIREDGSVFIVRRPRDGRLGGLWEFPTRLREDVEVPGDALCRLLDDLEMRSTRALEFLGDVEHAFTHVRVVYEVFVASVDGGSRAKEDAGGGYDGYPGEDRAWVQPGTLIEYAMPRAQRRIAALAEAAGVFTWSHSLPATRASKEDSRSDRDRP